MSTIKIGWGTRIALLYIGFVMIIVTLVVGSMHKRVDLVSDDYYKQELKYQNVIDAGKNQSELSAPVEFNFDTKNVVLSFPKEFAGKDIKGDVHFYSPVQNDWDKTIAIDSKNNTIAIEKSELRPTNYIAKLSWTTDGKNYYQETPINLSKHE